MSIEGRKIIWISPKWPLPADDGARRATVYLVRSLARLGTEIHYCPIVPRGEPTDLALAKAELGVREITVIHRDPPRRLKDFVTAPMVPLTVSPYATGDVARQIEAVLERSTGHSHIVFDGLHAAGWLLKASPAIVRKFSKVYRAHNVESNLWVLGAKQRKHLMSYFLQFQAQLVRDFERRVSRESKLVAAVSRDDENGLQKLYGPIRTINTPIGMPLDRARAEGAFPKSRNILFIGRLDWQPNRDGLRWFLENVWPEAAAASPDLSLTVAGAGDGSWLEPFKGLPRMRFLGRVPEVAPLYEEACASLVPVFFGSGTRVKAIEASSYARPCLSTAIGVEGIGLDPSSGYFRAETKDEWLKTLKDLSLEEARRRGKTAFDLIAREFDPDQIAARFLEAL